MAADERQYLGVAAPRPRVAFFELTSCEGCQLQLLNDEARLHDFLDLIEIVEFREMTSRLGDSYDIAFVEGSVSCAEEINRLKTIRETAGLVVAFGSCACFGGINQLRNTFSDRGGAKRRVYGDKALPVTPLSDVLPLEAVVPVDLSIYGCPVHKEEVERIVCELVIGKKISSPKYPVCMECTALGIVCRYELGEICLGPVTRGGCKGWCPASGASCDGCRGPAAAANIDELLRVVQERKLSKLEFFERLAMYGGFREWLQQQRTGSASETNS